MGIFGNKKGGDKDSEDIRVSLKLPGRGSLQNKQVANAFRGIKQLLRSSSGGGGGRTGVSTRQRGSAAAGSAAGRLGPAGQGGAGTAAAKPLQRVAVRWTYSGNKGDGQWGAHGKYIERESAQEKDLDVRPELAPEIEDGREKAPEVKDGRELADPINKQTKDIENERSDLTDPAGGDPGRNTFADRYEAAGPIGDDPGRIAALRKSHAAALAEKPAARSLNDLRSLSGLGMVQHPGRGVVLLQGDAPENLVERGPKDVDRVRRGSSGELGTPGGADRGLDDGGVGYGSAGRNVRISATLNSWQQGGDSRMFKLIISPEFGDRMDLRQHVTDLVKQMEKDLGTKLEWVAANHFNTDHPHAHVAIRGVDDHGKDLEISPAYIREGSRIRAQELATRELGYRSDRDVTESLERQVSQQRFTDIDRTLTKRAVNNVVSYEGDPPGSEKAREARLTQIRRLVQLSEMGLATRTGDRSWQLSPALETALRQMQVSQDRLKTKFAHRELISDPSAPLVVTELKEVGQRVAGKVVGTGLNDATSRAYIMVEGLDGKVHYMNQSPKIQKLRGEGGLKAGEYVAIEVVERKDRAGQVVGTMQSIQQYGRELTPALVDAELLKGGTVIERPEMSKSVAGAFRAAAAARLDRLQAAGAVAVAGGDLQVKSVVALDRVNYEDAGIKTVEFDGQGAMLATVVAKGQGSIAVAPTYGRKQQLTALQLEALGMQHKYVTDQASLFVGMDAKGKQVAAIIKAEQLPAMVADPRPNRLDSMAQQLKAIQLPKGHPVAMAINQRAEVWQKRGVDLKAADFAKAATVWRKNVEWAESGDDIANAIKARQLNRLDWMLQQETLATSAPLEKALQERVQVWKNRGLDPKDVNFAVRANVWRKGVELHEAARQKGVEQVIRELSLDKDKPIRRLDAKPGRQISGAVLVVKKEDDGGTTVVVDTGRELTVIRQPPPNDVDLKAGARIRAKVQEVNDTVSKRRILTWQFADMERQQALHKDKQKGGKAF